MKRVPAILFTVLLILESRSAFAQTPPFRTPLTGFVLDPARGTIRAIIGMPGAAQLAEPLPLPVALAAAEFSAAGDYALAVTNPGKRVILIRGLSNSPRVQILDGAIESLDRIALNEESGSAVLYSSASSLVQLVSGLPDNPKMLAPVPLDPAFGQVSAIAAGTRNSAVLAASDGTHGGVYEIGADLSVRLIASANRPAAILYLNRDSDVAYADAWSDQVVLIRDIAGAHEARMLASAPDGVRAPVALRWTKGLLLVANAGSGQLLISDLETGINSLRDALPVIPDRFQGLLYRDMFLLNSPGRGPLYIYSALDSNLLFVPPALEGPAQDSAVQGGPTQ